MLFTYRNDISSESVENPAPVCAAAGYSRRRIQRARYAPPGRPGRGAVCALTTRGGLELRLFIV